MKPLFSFATILVLGLTSLLVVVLYDDREVFIESGESKTIKNSPVFNRIRFFSKDGKDIWMMNQSHHGPAAEGSKWDRLAIVVDKNQSPKRAKFFQISSGELNWPTSLAPSKLMVSCFLCHNNGPRAIRPHADSIIAPLSVRDRLQIQLWNLRIKFYGRIVEDETHRAEDSTAEIPFRFRGKYENESLQVASCTKCHRESGFLARGELKRQQVTTIRHLIDTNQMPPPGFHLNAADASALQRFYQGF